MHCQLKLKNCDALRYLESFVQLLPLHFDPPLLNEMGMHAKDY